MKHLKIFEIFKTNSLNKKRADNYFEFFNTSDYYKVDKYLNYDIYSNEDGIEYFFTNNNIPFIYLQYKIDEIVIEDSVVKFPVIQYYTLKSEFRGKGLSLIPYDWLISKYNKIMSDYIQSKGDMVVWTKLFNKYHVTGYDAKHYKIIDDIYIDIDKMSLASKSVKIYNSANRLLINQKQSTY